MNELMIREGLLTRKTSKLFAFSGASICSKLKYQLKFQGLDLPREHLMPLLSSHSTSIN